jgi:hypothetical protein
VVVDLERVWIGRAGIERHFDLEGVDLYEVLGRDRGDLDHRMLESKASGFEVEEHDTHRRSGSQVR